MLYTMIVEQDFFGTFLGTFPDLPGCTAEGETMDELMENAQPAAWAWAAGQGLESLPAPEDREPDFSDPKHSPMLVEIAQYEPSSLAGEALEDAPLAADAPAGDAPAEA